MVVNGMTSSKPYLIRAIYDWILDNGLTPYIAVDVRIANVVVPEEYVKNNSIVLNISPISTEELLMENDVIEFKARFGGMAHNIYLPIGSITAIYAKENQQGLSFPSENAPLSTAKKSEVTDPSPKKMKLRILSGGKDSDKE